ncbi:hypothetical protein GYMLUDRAFT_166904 [Collybiopsis luxurians FD-317 M1]|uniref:Uncharacterized protein n=1 Tax=Collybiopsis luxurians FD-317 M1 TaxID=944289 RepID=A0A0D0BZC8_9AGAR|nr:hypothetical protein GYMLUDRAFT_166904 [Collybiopsis luxurians FD-317 M1]
MKPGYSCIKQIRSYFRSLSDPVNDDQLIVVGDRLFTDIVMANRFREKGWTDRIGLRSQSFVSRHATTSSSVTQSSTRDGSSADVTESNVPMSPALPPHRTLGVWTTSVWVREATLMRFCERKLLDGVKKWIIARSKARASKLAAQAKEDDVNDKFSGKDEVKRKTVGDQSQEEITEGEEAVLRRAFVHPLPPALPPSRKNGALRTLVNLVKSATSTINPISSAKFVTEVMSGIVRDEIVPSSPLSFSPPIQQVSIVSPESCTNEIEKLKDRPSRSLRRGTAVICGGSVAGLFAARICHEFFESVLIVEPEEWLTSEDAMRQLSWEQMHKRTRVMQYQSLHAFQALLLDGLAKLFPDLEEQCRRSGIAIRPSAREMNLAGPSVAIIPVPTRSYNGNLPKTLFQCTRAGFETLLRRMVLGRGRYPRIKQVAGTVVGVSPQLKDFGRIGKITVRGADFQLREIEASLVVDCTGYARAGAKWLAQAGYGTAPIPAGKLTLQDSKIALDSKLHYSTLTCNVSSSTLEKLPIPEDRDLETLFYALFEDIPENGRRLFVLTKADGNRLTIFVGQSSDELVKYETISTVRSLVQDLVPYNSNAPVPSWIFQTLDILEESRPELSYSHVRVPATAYIQYHKVANLPINFAALGDSVLSVNPLYGQGCTKAMLGAIALYTTLAQSETPEELPPDFSERYFKEHFNKTDSLWQTTRVLDYGVPCTKPIAGEDLSSGRLLRWYIRKLWSLAIKDEQARRVVWDGAMGYGTSVDPLNPWLAVKVLWNSVTGVWLSILPNSA